MTTSAPELVSYMANVKPLLRERVRKTRLQSSGLWSYDDVKTHATAILIAVADGSMPCDSTRPPENAAVLRAWINTGTAA